MDCTDTEFIKYNKSISHFQKICQRRILINSMTKEYKVKVGTKYYKLDPSKVFYDIRTLAFKKPILARTDNNFISEHGNNYDKLTEYIQKKPVLDIIKRIVVALYRYININLGNVNNIMEYMIAPQLSEKDLLCVFCLGGFPEFTLLKSPSELEKDKTSINFDIYNLSRKLIGKWGAILITTHNSNKQRETLRVFIKTLNMYSNCFSMFMHHDKQTKIQEGVQRWYYGEKQIEYINDNNNLSENDKLDAIKSIEMSQQKLIDLITKTDSQFNISQLKNYKQLTDKVEYNMEKGFWDVLKEELKNGKYDLFLKLLKEVRDDVLSLLPPNQNSFTQDTINQFDELFDLEFIAQMTNNGVYTCSSFVNLACFILDVMKKLQAPARTNDMIKEWNELLYRIEQNELELPEERGASIIKFLLNEVQLIKDNISALKLMAEFDINIFNV